MTSEDLSLELNNVSVVDIVCDHLLQQTKSLFRDVPVLEGLDEIVGHLILGTDLILLFVNLHLMLESKRVRVVMLALRV